MLNECKHCTAKLWSNFSKESGTCPDCLSDDPPFVELEDVLEDQETPRKF
jgi:hypothetical protein